MSESMGGVPGRVAFDNATEVGRRFGAVIHAGSLPRPFCAHHGLGHTLANTPAREAGGGASRPRRATPGGAPSSPCRPFPTRRATTPASWAGASRRHGAEPTGGSGQGGSRPSRGTGALPEPPPRASRRVGWEVGRCDERGVPTPGGTHRHSAGPAFARREASVALGATVVGPGTGEAIATHGRQRRDVPTGPSGPVPQLRPLAPRPGGREDGIAREGLPKGPASSTDGADGASGATPGPCATRAPSSAGRRRSRP